MLPDSTTGRRLDTIEITPAMIAAGAHAVGGYDAPFLDDHEKAELIFRAMLAKAGYATRSPVEGCANRPGGKPEPISV